MDTSPVFIVDDDSDDRMFVEEAWKELNFASPLIFFATGEEMLKHLHSHAVIPFIIISEVNLPLNDGFALREKLTNDASLKYKSIPFIFWSQQASKEQIQKAYDLSSHGFFIKEEKPEKIKKFLKVLMEYWAVSKVPK